MTIPRSASRTSVTRFALLVVVIGAVVAACAPPPSTIDVPGGTYPVPVTLGAQQFQISFSTCQTSVTTQSFSLSGVTVTIPPTSLDPTQSPVLVHGVTVMVPAQTSPPVNFNLSCLGIPIGSIDAGLTTEAFTSTMDATVDVASRTVTLVNATFPLTGVGVVTGGITASVPLPPLPITFPPITISF